MTTITHSSGVVTPTIADGYSSVRTPGTIMHPILGRESDDVTLRPAALRKGTLTLVFAVEADAHAAVLVLTTPQMLQLDDPDVSISMSFVIADGDITVSLDDVTQTVWIVEAPFREVSP